jgi:hypothetical protein
MVNHSSQLIRKVEQIRRVVLQLVVGRQRLKAVSLSYPATIVVSNSRLVVPLTAIWLR